ncbi:hypothetical protein [Sphingomonas crocodyli]|uniref:Uncharacterized protein n=1 Tax=Sphingomonas crocodyli TaxID=1979270 RepID=A0A437LVC1_9SPHN|nr:hypothetical protein [Sphingomonas crocodyli]RVT89314.1 hypothetical protein EOD43_21315 [Sphingomonas crocodyli]
MEQPPKIRRRRRRRRSRALQETQAWIVLLIRYAKTLWHWLMLLALIIFILLVGFAYPTLA